MPTVIDSPNELIHYTSQQLGVSDWVEITQDRINMFADATGDHQWIHVDEDRAKDGPFGGTIAHGYLTLSLAAVFLGQVMTVSNVNMALNYGLNKVRFTAPVPVGSRVRATGELVEVIEKRSGIEAIIRLTYEIEDSGDCPCIAELVILFR